MSSSALDSGPQRATAPPDVVEEPFVTADIPQPRGPRPADEPAAAAVLAQLARLERSAALKGSDRLLAFLRFAVERTLEDGGASLRETVVGNAVYARQPPYDPRIDSTVRVEARRLRRKLKDYYTMEGAADAVFIDLPVGSYTPTFATKIPPLDPASVPPSSAPPSFEKGNDAAIAVLPFRALDHDGDIESFADGLTDEVIFALAHAKSIRVLSRTTHFQQTSRIDAGAAELGVDAVVQGTVRRHDDCLRVAVEISDHRGFIVFCDRFDVPDENHVRLQERIATTTLSRLCVGSSFVRDCQLRPGWMALESMAKVLRARCLLDRQSPTAIREALAIFGEVNATTPDYARGHAGVADAWCDLFRLGLVGRKEALANAAPAARRAVAIDPHSTEVVGAMATISAWLERDGASPERRYRQACEPAENARAARLYAVFLARAQRHDEAARQLRAARAIEPFSIQQDVTEAFSHWQARRFDALKPLRRDAEREDASPELVFPVVLADIFAGEHAEAERLLDNLAVGAADFPDLAFSVAEAEVLLGRPKSARKALLRRRSASHFAHATLAAALGEEDRCLTALASAFERQEPSVVWLRSDARFDRLRKSRRFAALVARLDEPIEP